MHVLAMHPAELTKEETLEALDIPWGLPGREFGDPANPECDPRGDIRTRVGHTPCLTLSFVRLRKAHDQASSCPDLRQY